MKIQYLLFTLMFLAACQEKESALNDLPISPGDLHFEDLAQTWDEGIPLGNGMIGALIWKKEGKLRMSLDRADLWDLRPMANLDVPEWKYSWVFEQWKNDNYKAVQDRFDVPYNKSPAPTKIPGGALEIEIKDLGEIEHVHLYVRPAICEIKWTNGVRFLTYVHATDPIGFFRFEGLDKLPPMKLIPPAYDASGVVDGEANSLEGHDLRRLGYKGGTVVETDDGLSYTQSGWDDFSYRIDVGWSDQAEAVWSIATPARGLEAPDLLAKSFSASLVTHEQWWSNYWSQSSVSLPDSVLQKQWLLEMYKFGSAARPGAPPISLQAVWTADHGQIPPWKGDFHHDLNTQLSYWPAYSGNHLDLEVGFIDWLWKYQETFKSYTKSYYETDGLNVPGVTTLEGAPMGGWIQYSFGPTVSAWLAHHFYLHWRYSMDREFLKGKAYPWIKQVAVHLAQLGVPRQDGLKKLPISSSPEIHDNSREAWFDQTTNFDLGLIRWTFSKASELASELELNQEASDWKAELSKWPELAVDTTGLLFAPGAPYDQSHRHFSNLIAFHPLGQIDYSHGENEQIIIDRTLANLEDKGTDWWVGYSFAWMANLKARTFNGEGAVEYLRTFATSFCLPNSFHVNGDQSGQGLSKFTYRPFTLEGNFAFAAGVQEMLLQSHTGVVQIFPAVPADWKNVEFEQLRAEGAFVFSAKKVNGKVESVDVIVEKGGDLVIRNPFAQGFKTTKEYKVQNDLLLFKTNPGEVIGLIGII